ncbi:MAG TPA: hypothetical protein VLX92_13640 [Kofleriaceae bacterium]|nr:hypothetical protein [Kofleriaceae bacterium]
MLANLSRFAVLATTLAACFPMFGGSSGSMKNGPGTDAQPLAAHPFPLVNADGEKIAWAAAQEWAPKVGTPAPTILRAYVVDDRDWVIDRNDNTGIITDRFLHVAVQYRGGNTGKCRQWLCNLIEQEAGPNAWGRPILACPNGLTVALTCDSVEAGRPSPPT